jgi:hypothetical protein
MITIVNIYTIENGKDGRIGCWKKENAKKKLEEKVLNHSVDGCLR